MPDSSHIYLIRHASAAESGEGPPPEGVPDTVDPEDAARPVTPRGARRFAEVVQGLRDREIGFDRLYHSPLLRAVHTAEILEDLLEGESVVEPGLAAPPTERLLGALQGRRVAVVGHQPWLGELLGLLALGDATAGRAFLWKKGGVAWLEGTCAPGGMTIRGFWAPRMIRREA